MARTKIVAKQLKLASKATRSSSSAHAKPKHAEEQPCLAYCCSAFASFQDPVITRDITDLDNQIHPIFRRKNFSKDFDYTTLKPTLRLASLLLESDALVPYINVMAHGELQCLNGLREGQVVTHPRELFGISGIDPEAMFLCNWRSARHPKPGQDEVNDLTRIQARQTLAELADMVEFTLVPEASDGSANAHAVWVEGPLNVVSAKAFPSGCRTSVQISAVQYDPIESYALLADYKTWQEDCWTHGHILDWVVISQFGFAVTLLHELGHALNHASMGSTRAEPFYKDSLVSEGGMQLETQLFGGMMGTNFTYDLQEQIDPGSHWDYPNPYCIEKKMSRPFICLKEFPSDSLILLYQHIAAPMVFRGKRTPFDKLWRVPTHFIQSLFTKAYWEGVVAKRGPDALKPPRTLGWMFTSGRRGSLHPLSGADATLPLASIRAMKKWNYGHSQLPDRPDSPRHVFEDWSEFLDDMAVEWQKMFDGRTRTQRKRENRKSAMSLHKCG
ncbi:hypothetical protein LTR85_011700 [Meristemomyces frigidus]|nr:hypothetical protein LTR85_011700 [Meristemomyces frigidus]